MDSHWVPTTRPGLEPREAPPLTAAEKLRCAFELHESAVAMLRQNLRRRHPEFTDEQVDEGVRVWLHTRPADGVGTPINVMDWLRRNQI